MASYANLSADQGADFQISIDIEDANGDPLDLTNYALYGQVRRTYKSDNAYDFTIEIDDDPATGTIAIQLLASQTKSMKSGRYVYDIYAHDTITNEVIKVLEGILELVPSVTKNIEL